MYCNYCGKEIPQEAVYCPSCGKQNTGTSEPKEKLPRRKNCWDYFTDVIKDAYRLVVDGKCSMAKYWSFALFYTAFFVATGAVEAIPIVKGLLYIFNGFTGLVLFSLSIKRIHDTNNPGWKIFIPVYNLILLLSKGTESNEEFVNEGSNADSNAGSKEANSIAEADASSADAAPEQDETPESEEN